MRAVLIIVVLLMSGCASTPDYQDKHLQRVSTTLSEIGGTFRNVDLSNPGSVYLGKDGSFEISIHPKGASESVARGSWRLENSSLVIAEVVSGLGKHETIFLRATKIQGYGITLQLLASRDVPTPERLGEVSPTMMFFHDE